MQFLTDLLYTRFTSLYANGLANHTVPVYYYVLDYYGTNGIMNIIGDTDMKSKYLIYFISIFFVITNSRRLQRDRFHRENLLKPISFLLLSSTYYHSVTSNEDLIEKVRVIPASLSSVFSIFKTFFLYKFSST